MSGMSDMPTYLARLANPAGEKNAFSKLFDDMSNADEVRAWVKKDPHQFWAEYPRGSGPFNSMLSGLARCKHASELQDDIKKLYHAWYSNP